MSVSVLAQWRADYDLLPVDLGGGQVMNVAVDVGTEKAMAAIRCFRCGGLMLWDAVVWRQYQPECVEHAR